MSANENSPIWKRKHLLDLQSLSPEELRLIFQTAETFKEVSTRSVKKAPALRGCVVANLFFEPSTRTTASFHLAASRLSADILDFSASGSSLSKGETLSDTVRNIEAMGVDIMVCRHGSSGAAKLVANAVNCAVVNAGDGQHEHPTQGLLDIFTMAQRLKRPDYDMTGLTIAIVGDIAHSRVARSNIHGIQKLGGQVIVVGPPTLVPRSFEAMGVEVCHDFDAVLDRVDAVNMLRVQFERQSTQSFPSKREYSKLYGLTRERLAQTKGGLLVMHPGPINRGLEIESSVADGPNSAILEQVENGLAVRMAVLFLVNAALHGNYDEPEINFDPMSLLEY